jgi:hypothetical protein
MKNWVEELELEETVSKKKADFYFQKESIPKKEFTKDDSAKIDIMAMNFHEVVQVLEFGAKKYAPDNWKHVEGHRYDDALLRHVQAYMGGEMNDPETGLHHLAHATCCILFKIYLDKNPK